MMTFLRTLKDSYRPISLIFLLWAGSLPLKMLASQQMPFDHDYVPVVSLGWAWLMGGDFPAYGTLSSVSAYNMPMLIWLYLPAQLIASNVAVSIFITGAILNLIGAVALLRWAGGMFGVGAGLVSASLFLFSEVGISASYTAWAQLQLPVFFALASYCAWRWWSAQGREDASWWLALMGICAFASFMLHFASVILFVGLLVSALLVGARWTWQGLLGGALVCALLIAPYAIFQAGRDWVDIRAFLTRETPIPRDSLLAIRDGVQENSSAVPDASPAEASPIPEISPGADNETSSRFERGIAFALNIPAQLWRVLWLPYEGYHARHWVEGVFLLIGLIGAGISALQAVQREKGHWWRVDWRVTADGRALLIVVMLLSFGLGLTLTRNAPSQQFTYYYGTYVWHFALVGYGFMSVWAWCVRVRWGAVIRGAIISALVFTMGITAYERIDRIRAWDDTRADSANIWLYRHIEGVAGAIGQAHEGTSLSIGYDILRYERQLWWVEAWHTVDAAYRVGMPFDYLLERYYGIQNRNQAGGDKMPEDADYIVTTRAGVATYLERHGASSAQYFGGLVLIRVSES